jgi:hypothetical protein
MEERQRRSTGGSGGREGLETTGGFSGFCEGSAAAAWLGCGGGAAAEAGAGRAGGGGRGGGRRARGERGGGRRPWRPRWARAEAHGAFAGAGRRTTADGGHSHVILLLMVII